MQGVSAPNPAMCRLSESFFAFDIIPVAASERGWSITANVTDANLVKTSFLTILVYEKVFKYAFSPFDDIFSGFLDILILVANCQTERDSYLLCVETSLDFSFRHQYQIDGEPGHQKHYKQRNPKHCPLVAGLFVNLERSVAHGYLRGSRTPHCHWVEEQMQPVPQVVLALRQRPVE
jgi:hypothetical protein